MNLTLQQCRRAVSHPLWLAPLALLLAACASTAPRAAAPAESLFHDELFAAPAKPVDTAALFALSEPMRRYADTEIRRAARGQTLERALFDALYGEGQLKLDYDSAMTRNAAQAFEARMGNCLSLVVMTAAFAKHFELPVRFQQVYAPDTVSRSGRLTFSSGHVNLNLARPRAMRPGIADWTDASLTIDFVPDTSRGRVRVIPESMIVAMYLNNRAAELLAESKPQEAYWWAREAVSREPAFTESHNTLGVIYRHAGHWQLAEDAFRRIVALEPENVLALTNLAGLLAERGRADEAARVQATLSKVEPHPPFHFHDQGVAALAANDFETARQAFRRELNRAAYLSESHFGLAVALLHLGRWREAEKHLGKALESSTTQTSRQLYSGKLDWIRQQEQEHDKATRGTSRLPSRRS